MKEIRGVRSYAANLDHGSIYRLGVEYLTSWISEEVLPHLSRFPGSFRQIAKNHGTMVTALSSLVWQVTYRGEDSLSNLDYWSTNIDLSPPHRL